MYIEKAECIPASDISDEALLPMEKIHTPNSKTIEELTAFLLDYKAKINAEYDGILDKGIDVYTGVDRSIFKGTFAMTSAAERQQALTGETWDIHSAIEEY